MGNRAEPGRFSLSAGPLHGIISPIRRASWPTPASTSALTDRARAATSAVPAGTPCESVTGRSSTRASSSAIRFASGCTVSVHSRRTPHAQPCRQSIPSDRAAPARRSTPVRTIRRRADATSPELTADAAGAVSVRVVRGPVRGSRCHQPAKSGLRPRRPETWRAAAVRGRGEPGRARFPPANAARWATPRARRPWRACESTAPRRLQRLRLPMISLRWPPRRSARRSVRGVVASVPGAGPPAIPRDSVTRSV